MRAHLLLLGILHGADEAGKLVAHGLGGDAGSGCLEVDVAAASCAGVEGVGAGEEVCHVSVVCVVYVDGGGGGGREEEELGGTGPVVTLI